MTQSRRVPDGEILDIEQTVDPDGTVRLVVTGELDQASAEGLTQKFEELKRSGEAIRLDLSRLEFIDSGGVRAVLIGFRDAQAEARGFEVDRRLSWQVKQVFDTLGLDAALWPGDGDAR